MNAEIISFTEIR